MKIHRFLTRMSKTSEQSVRKSYPPLLVFYFPWLKQRFSLLQEKVVIQAVRLRTQAVSIESPVLDPLEEL